MDFAELRRQFPHTGRSVYLNHAATGPLSRPVVRAMARYLEQRHRSKVENYAETLPLVEATRARLAHLIGTHVGRIEFAPNTSYALNVLAQGLDWRPGDRVLVPGCEFPANVYPFMNLERRGVQVDFVPHRYGTFSVEEVERRLTPDTRLLTVSWVQFLSGFRADLGRLGALCRDRGVLLSVDAIQGLGAVRLGASVEDLGIDFLASGGHKWLMGAQGIGFLYCSDSLQERLVPALAGWLHGPVDWDNFFDYDLVFHPDATRFRLGTLNHLGITALHAALGLYLEADPEACERRVLALADRLRTGLTESGLRLYGSSEPAHASGIVAVRHPRPDEAYRHLRLNQIEISLRNKLLRFAPTYYNTEDEIDRTVDILRSLHPR